MPNQIASTTSMKNQQKRIKSYIYLLKFPLLSKSTQTKLKRNLLFVHRKRSVFVSMLEKPSSL